MDADRPSYFHHEISHDMSARQCAWTNKGVRKWWEFFPHSCAGATLMATTKTATNRPEDQTFSIKCLNERPSDSGAFLFFFLSFAFVPFSYEHCGRLELNYRSPRLLARPLCYFFVCVCLCACLDPNGYFFLPPASLDLVLCAYEYTSACQSYPSF